jgi:hypothetical protein
MAAMISRALAAVGVAAWLVVAPTLAHAGQEVLMGPGAGVAAFGLAALLGGHMTPPAIYPAPSVIVLPPVVDVPPPRTKAAPGVTH